MALNTVNPGDLIKSLDWNELIALVNAMELRIAILESGTATQAPRITQILPAGPVTAGQIISIYGSGFDFSTGGHSVFFGSTRATGFLTGSSDTLLIVEVPDPVLGASEAGTAMALNVGNLVAVTSLVITVKAKPVVTAGGMAFTYKGSTPTTPATGENFYDFELRSFASENLEVTVSPTIAVIQPLPGGVVDPILPSRIVLIDADSTVKADNKVMLLEGATKTVRLRLTLPNNVPGLKYSLTASATAPGVAPLEEPLPNQQVGQASEQPDSTVTSFNFSTMLNSNGSHSSSTGGVSGVDGTISVKPGLKATFELDATFAIPAGPAKQYQLSATVDSPATGWTAATQGMENPLSVSSSGIIPIDYGVTAPASAPPTVLRLTITRLGVATNNKRTVAYRLLVQ
jgi:hypothetical protein